LRPKIPMDPLEATVREMAEQQRTARQELEQLAKSAGLSSASLLAENQREMANRLALLDLGRATFEPLDRLVEEARATVGRLDELAKLAGVSTYERAARELALGRFTLPEEQRVSMSALAAQLATVGRFSDEQERVLRAIGSVRDSLSGIFESERVAMLARDRIIEESSAAMLRSTMLCDLARDRFAALPFDSIGQLAGFDAVDRAAAVGRLSTFATSYQDYTNWISRNVPRPWELPDFLTERPARDLFASVETLDVLSLPREEEEETEGEAGDDGDAPLADLLAEIHPELRRMWLGARRALEDRGNPARVRAFAGLAVELCDHTLRVAAPDDLVRPWALPEHFLDARYGRKTRELRRAARWAYLARDLGNVGMRYGPLMELAVVNMLDTIGELQQVKHQLTSSLTPGAARVVVAQVDAGLRGLYIVWKAQRN
jgi:hypothetical protein